MVEQLESLLQTALADVAPRAHHVGPDLYEHENSNTDTVISMPMSVVRGGRLAWADRVRPLRGIDTAPRRWGRGSSVRPSASGSPAGRSRGSSTGAAPRGGRGR